MFVNAQSKPVAVERLRKVLIACWWPALISKRGSGGRALAIR
jgi:hypothetical protein